MTTLRRAASIDAESPVVLEARGVGKTFGATRALRDASIELRKGTIHGIIGHNGAGKSTLVKVLSGVLQPDEGSILIDGDAVAFGSPIDASAAGVAAAYAGSAATQVSASRIAVWGALAVGSGGGCPQALNSSRPRTTSRPTTGRTTVRRVVLTAAHPSWPRWTRSGRGRTSAATTWHSASETTEPAEAAGGTRRPACEDCQARPQW